MRQLCVLGSMLSGKICADLELSVQPDSHVLTMHAWVRHDGSQESITLQIELGLVAWHLWLPRLQTLAAANS